MNILLMHRNFPAQFVHIADYLRRFSEHKVVFLTNRADVDMSGVHKVVYQTKRAVSKKTHSFLQGLEEAVLEGQAAEEATFALKQQGFRPDVIYGHSGWGAPLFMKDVYPDVPLMGYFEWFYHPYGADVDFGGRTVTPDDEARLRMKNTPILLDLEACSCGVSPTYWQQSRFPLEYVNKIKVIHDGVNTQWCAPKPGPLVLPDKGLDLSQVPEIITYVGRGMEPYRGFPQFMEALDIVLRRRPQAHAVIVGNQKDVFYSPQRRDGKSYKDIVLETLDLDMTRVHFTGHLPKHQYLQVLQASSVHVYLTVPFVLSWSMLEAMSCGCMLVASDTQPVREVVNHGVTGLLADMLKPQELAERIEEALVEKRQAQAMRRRARELILDRYDLNRVLPRHLELIQQVAQAGRNDK